MKKNADDAFWSDFVKKNWEKKPAHFSKINLSIMQLDQNTVFDWLVGYSNYCRKTKTTEGFKFYINGESQYQNEVLQSLPIKSDKTLLGYHQRISELFSDYCLVCDELIQVSGAAWNVLGDFTKKLYQKVGLPNRPSEIGLYLGNYKKTPFGVHVDGCGVFSIPIVGEKKFRLWTAAYVKKNTDLELAFEYPHHIKASKVLTAVPGDLTYWPSSAWHIAESNGSFSATWSLGVWVDQDYSDIVSETLKPYLVDMIKHDSTRKLIPYRNQISSTGQIRHAPPLMQRTAQKISRLSEAEIDDLFLKKWLTLSSKNGFKSVPLATKSISLKRTDWIQADPRNPVLWAQLSDHSVCIASHGKLMTLKKSKANTKFLTDLNSGSELFVNAVIGTDKNKNNRFKILIALAQMQRLAIKKKQQTKRGHLLPVVDKN